MKVRHIFIMHIVNFFVLFSYNPNRLENFYRKGLNFSCCDDDGYGYEEYERDGIVITFQRWPDNSTDDIRQTILSLWLGTAEEVDELYAMAIANGGSHMHVPWDAPGGRSASFYDPDGNVIHIGLQGSKSSDFLIC